MTHFLCLPLITDANRPPLSAALSKLRQDVENLTPVPPKAVRPVGTLHLTLGVMSLSSEQLDDVSKHLQELDIGQVLRGITTQKLAEEAYDTPTVSENFGPVAHLNLDPSDPALAPDPGSLVIELTGLVPMQKPKQTSILYAEPRDASRRLLRFASSVKGSFEQNGWVVHDDRPLRLHATVLNTIYAKPRGRGRGKGKGRQAFRPTTDAEAGGKDVEFDGVDEDKDKFSQQGTDGEIKKEEENEERSKAHGPGAKSWMRFDATSLIEAYKDFVWAEDVRIDRVQICKMGAQKILHEETGEIVDEKYEVVAEKSI